MEASHNLVTHMLEAGYTLAKRYSIMGRIGYGGMANVYLAYDLERQEEVAVKVLHRQFAEDKNYVARFLREAKLMTAIESTQVVRAFDLGTDGHSVYLAMEYVKGCALDKLLDSHRFQPLEIAYIMSEICKGLEAVHAQRVIYRDLKPANVLISIHGEVKLTDFGVAREEGSKLTASSQKLGSICYIAPEVWLGKKLSSAVDLYSLGIVAYELCTAEVPFESPYPGTIMQQHLSDEVMAPSKRNPKISGWLNHLTVRLLAKSPKSRPTALDVVAECKKNALSNADVGEIARSIGTLAEKLVRIEGAHGEWPKVSVREDEVEESAQGTSSRRAMTYILRMTATQIIDEKEILSSESESRRAVSITIPLPKHAAVIIEIEPPSRDFIFLGIFLVSLQIFDGILTAEGVHRMSIDAEGNHFLKYLMYNYGVNNTLLFSKGIAIALVLVVTYLARRLHWIKNLIAFMSVVYLCFAIIPWLIALRFLR